MFSKLKAAWARMTGGRAAGESDEPNTPAIEYQGYRIRATPYRTERQYQTAGIIEKNFPPPGIVTLTGFCFKLRQFRSMAL